MKLYVTIKVDGRYTAEIEVPDGADLDTIKSAALAAYEDADIGALESVDAECVNYETPDGHLVDLN